MKYTIYIELDPFADPQRYPDGIAWRSGVLDHEGTEIDGQGDLPDFATAKDLAMSTLDSYLTN